MKIKISRTILLLLLLLITNVVAKETVTQDSNQLENSQPIQVLPETVSSLINRYKIDKKNLSFYVKDLSSGNVLLTYNANIPRNPASTMKLLTTYAALKLLKPSYRWRTEVWVRGEIKEETLHGDLILKGYGDPFLIHKNYWALIQGIRDKGLKHITGQIFIDNSYFNLPEMNPGAFDSEPYRVYNAIPSAFMYNYQATRFLFRPDKDNKKIDIIPYPQVATINYVNKVTYDQASCQRKHYRPKFAKKDNTITITGSYSAACGQQFILRAVSEPQQHAYNGFVALWQAMGGNSGKGLADFTTGELTENDELFHTYLSDSLGEQIRIINKWSNNVMTRQLLLTLGAKKYGEPATLEKGRRAILTTLAENGINNNGIIIDNGSGLSRIARITTTQHVELLERAWKDEFMPEFMSSLSLSGLDGTLIKRFRENDMRGRSHMKTGTLRDVKSLAGYMLNRNERWLLVVIHHNGPKIGANRGSRIQDALLQWAFEQ